MTNRLAMAWTVALVATCGSLYFSEVIGFIPCTLCWYQRILMYPLSLLLGVAVVKNDRSFALYALVLSIPGALIALYHYLIQKVPAMHQLGACTQGVPCNGQYINWFGFVTIPFLSLAAFTLITGLAMSLLIKKKTS